MRLVGKSIGYIEYLLMALSALAVTLMMLVTVVDVVLRYVFNSPLGWTVSFITDYLMVALFFLGLSYTFRVGGHISVEALVRRLPGKGRRILNVSSNVLACLFFAVIVYTGALRAWEAWVANAVPTGGGTLPWPTWTSYILIPLGTAVLVLRILNSTVSPESPSDRSAETEAL